MSTPPTQDALFDSTPEPDRPGALSYQPTDTAAYSAALAGDAYGWLARVLPAPAALVCPRCHQPMSLPAAVPLLWECPPCDTRDTTGDAS